MPLKRKASHCSGPEDVSLWELVKGTLIFIGWVVGSFALVAAIMLFLALVGAGVISPVWAYTVGAMFSIGVIIAIVYSGIQKDNFRAELAKIYSKEYEQIVNDSQ